ncbi:pyrimidine reductase family protein [Corynebacterium pacaense]|uniref:pyrimidine reductase family protein n=1 Tax=Corynebacterium pacaense TaxID=1816684 RepID=UPI0009B952E6|nr:pyrimidine reductase family protein [Corynebacterium pacaense]
MPQVIPDSPKPDLAELLGPLPDPVVAELRALVVSTITGSATIDATSGDLGNALDSALLVHLRGWCDVVLVGSGTVRAENYGGVRIDPARRASRVRDGQAEVPPIAVLSSHLHMDTGSRLFTDTAVPPIVLTGNAGATARASLEHAGARVHLIPDLSIKAAVSHLRDMGFKRILCEGGPSVFAQLIEADLIDVWHHTIDPRLSAPVELPVVTDGSGGIQAMELEHVAYDDESMLFLRYRRTR